MYAIGQYYFFKGELCRFGKQNSNSKYLQGNEVIIQNWLLFPLVKKKSCSEENKVPRTLFEAKKVAGSTKYTQ